MLKVTPVFKNILMITACLAVAPIVNAAVSLDRTRAVFNGGEKR